MPDANATALPRRVKDLTGQRFGRLTVVGYAGKNKQRFALWLCQCDCGTKRTVRSSSLRCGFAKSCGCLQKETAAARTTTHGLSSRPEFRNWTSMLARCSNPSNPDYGGRGITVCARWRESFAAFFEDMGPKPDGHRISIERLNNDGHYEPGNCVWATPKDQTRNSRRNRLLTHDGKTMCVSEWSEETGIPSSVLFSRLYHGWSVERALTEPVHVTNRRRPR